MKQLDTSEIYLSVVVPAYNEEKRIERTLLSVVQYLESQSYSYEIIVVNDGSEDGTAGVVTRLSRGAPAIRMIDYKENRGKGWAVKQGMLSAKGALRLFMDADNSTTVDQFERVIPHFEGGADIVIGSRRVEGARITLHQSWFRENLGRVFNLVVRSINGLHIEDTQAGFKAFTAEAAESIFPLQSIWGWSFDVEVLNIADALGLSVKEVPIEWRNDPGSHVSLIDSFGIISDIFKVRWRALRGVYGERRNSSVADGTPSE